MKALFNGNCDGCAKFMPQCAIIHIKPSFQIQSWEKRVQTRCPSCRKRIKGIYTLDARHK